ncbi:unnamed protein product [Thlaspi arvense]|uniref:Hexosyltransferase n=1 Tax=Thlaspi arvense TaxID=13288 RepID=A0AAU9S3J4_THLAR|nr:unnamed protein product [Thlaspi arvense]
MLGITSSIRIVTGENGKLYNLFDLFSQKRQVLGAINATTSDLDPLSLESIRKKRLSMPSWKGGEFENSSEGKENQVVPNFGHGVWRGGVRVLKDTPEKLYERSLRHERRATRANELMNDGTTREFEKEALQRSRSVDTAAPGNYTIWKNEYRKGKSFEDMLLLLKDQTTMARVYTTIAKMTNNLALHEELETQLAKLESMEEVLSDVDKQESIVLDTIREMGQLLARASEQLHECKLDPSRHVFHLVTDKINMGAMSMWFLLNPPGDATIEVQRFEDFAWLNSSYSPVLRQAESAAMKKFYFKTERSESAESGSENLKFRYPKYISMLNHLRFYIPKMFPKLEKILFLDDDVVVQKDLAPLWSVDLRGKVNGAVETCGVTFHRLDTYLNFSDQHISGKFDPKACGWAYGMNIFDLKEWRKNNITETYHFWQNLNENRTLWKLGTLPPGLIAFYNLTQPLAKKWHLLGLGYDKGINTKKIEKSAVIHFNGHMKPWSELGISKYQPYWTKYINIDHPYIFTCRLFE